MVSPRPDSAVRPKPPVSEIDPFCREFFEDPFPAYRVREAGPVVRLSRYGVWASARYQEVHAILNDWQTFCSSRGAGLTDFAKEKTWRPKSLVLETDPPLHTAPAAYSIACSPLL